MSNTDPDLKPTERNRPTAIDVVDGELIVKRHSGREESFPIGGAPSSKTLDWYVIAPDLGVGTMPGPPTSYATLFDGVDEVQTVLDADFGVPDHFQAFPIGDEYFLIRTGADALMFRKPGLYVVTINGPSPTEDTGDIFVMGLFSTTTTYHYVVTQLFSPVGSPGGAVGQMVIPVSLADLTTWKDGDPTSWATGSDDVPSGGSFNIQVSHSAGAAQDLPVELYITRC